MYLDNYWSIIQSFNNMLFNRIWSLHGLFDGFLLQIHRITLDCMTVWRHMQALSYSYRKYTYHFHKVSITFIICHMKMCTHPFCCQIYSNVVSISKSFDFGLVLINNMSLERLYAKLVFWELLFLIINILYCIFLMKKHWTKQKHCRPILIFC